MRRLVMNFRYFDLCPKLVSQSGQHDKEVISTTILRQLHSWTPIHQMTILPLLSPPCGRVMNDHCHSYTLDSSHLIILCTAISVTGHHGSFCGEVSESGDTDDTPGMTRGLLHQSLALLFTAVHVSKTFQHFCRLKFHIWVARQLCWHKDPCRRKLHKKRQNVDRVSHGRIWIDFQSQYRPLHGSDLLKACVQQHVRRSGQFSAICPFC